MNALLLTALLAAPRAEAYNLLGYVWAADDIPVEWYMTDYEEDSLSNATSWGYDSVSDYQVSMVQDSFENWYEAECADISDEYMGIDAGNEGSSQDLINKFYWDDPLGIYGTGILAVASMRPSAEYLREQEGVYLYALSDVDITFNDDIDWGLTEEVEAACSSGTVAVEPVATHEIGHLWGIAHTCEEGEECPTEAERYATMYYAAAGGCDTSRKDINSEDLGAINALYGPYVTFFTDDERFGSVPHTVCFELTASENAEVLAVEWDFGDGNTSTEMNPCHTYEEQGQYTVVVTVSGDAKACGGWEFEYRERAYIIVCEPPAPGLSPEGEQYGGLFTYEHDEGLIYQMVNRTDTSVYGCLDTVIWQVYDEGGTMLQEISAWSPKIEFPEEGSFRVLLNVGGPGGMGAADITIDTNLDSEGGCNAAPVGVGLLALLSSLGLALGRRRRLF